MIISLPLKELRLYYLAQCDDYFEHMMMYGNLMQYKPEIPTLTGWIKYWRAARINNIYYPKLDKILKYDAESKQYIEIRLITKTNAEYCR